MFIPHTPHLLHLVVELGAGCALLSLLASTLANTPALVVTTCYPSDVILSNLETNVTQNAHLAQDDCRVVSLGYEWGADASAVL
jgi:nicotinamide N-methyltransferase